MVVSDQPDQPDQRRQAGRPRSSPAWLDELEPAPGPPWLRMGTRALARDGWLLGGPDVPGQIEAKARILADHHDEAVVTPPGTEAPAAELLALVGEASSGPAAGLVTAQAADAGGRCRHPLDQAGRSVAEDLCLLESRAGGWVLVAGSVCFPSYWRLRDKVGRPVAAIHAPVPRYEAELAPKVDRFLDRLGVDRPAWRRNWTVHASPELFVPDPSPTPEPPVTAADAGDRLWLRSERQTLRRLPRTGAVVFTIRTQQVRLRAVAARPGLCAPLAEAVSGWPDDLVAYRGGEAIRRPLVAWLHAAAAGAAASG